MRRTKLPLILSLLTFFGCASMKDKQTASHWSALKLAEPVDCHPWPVLASDLDVTRLTLIGDKSKGFVSEGRARTGRSVQYFVSYQSDPEIAKSDLKALEWGDQAEFLNGLEMSGKQFGLLLSDRDDDSASLELRDLATNLVYAKTAAPAPSIEDVAIFPTDSHDFWVSYKKPVDEEALDDLPAQIAFVTASANPPKMTLTNAKNVEIIGRPVLLPSDKPKAVLALWLDIGTSTNVRASLFKARDVELGDQDNPAKTIDVPITNSVESWAAIADGKDILLAYVDGDSLLGDANLKVARIQWKLGVPRIQWVKSKALTNEHVADPFWVRKGESSFVILPKWLDNESTLGAYEATADDVKSVNIYGVFSEGTTLLGAFHDPGEGGVNAIVRYNKGRLKEYALCELEGL